MMWRRLLCVTGKNNNRRKSHLIKNLPCSVIRAGEILRVKQLAKRQKSSFLQDWLCRQKWTQTDKSTAFSKLGFPAICGLKKTKVAEKISRDRKISLYWQVKILHYSRQTQLLTISLPRTTIIPVGTPRPSSFSIGRSSAVRITFSPLVIST